MAHPRPAKSAVSWRISSGPSLAFGRAKSTADFISKMTTVEEETDETSYWLEVLVEGNLVRQERVATLMNEADQLIRIVVASIKTARGRKR